MLLAGCGHLREGYCSTSDHWKSVDDCEEVEKAEQEANFAKWAAQHPFRACVAQQTREASAGRERFVGFQFHGGMSATDAIAYCQVQHPEDPESGNTPSYSAPVRRAPRPSVESERRNSPQPQVSAPAEESPVTGLGRCAPKELEEMRAQKMSESAIRSACVAE